MSVALMPPGAPRMMELDGARQVTPEKISANYFMINFVQNVTTDHLMKIMRYYLSGRVSNGHKQVNTFNSVKNPKLRFATGPFVGHCR